MREKTRQPFQPDIPQGMIHAMKDDRMHPRVTGQYLPGIPGCWVTVEYATDVFTNADKAFLDILVSLNFSEI